MDSNLSVLSQSNNEFKLLCWALNQSKIPFSVKIGKNETVDELKKAIKQDMGLAGLNPATLTLWKLSSPIPSSELNKLRHTRTLQEIDGDCVELDPFNELSEYFSSPSCKHIHIIVQLPLNRPSGDTQIRQFRLLCEKYWNKGEEGRVGIYKDLTVQVPFLARPGAEEVATTSEGMVIDAESPEIDALEAKTMSASSIDTSEGPNERLDDLDFNFAVSYESLSLGPDFHGFFGNGYSSILVRKEYRDMFQYISDLHKKGERGVVVNGMPGIGKSFFVYFVLIERILNGQCTAYQCNSTRVILMLGRDDVRFFPANEYLDPQGFPGTWALVDSNVQLVQPRSEFTDTHSEFYVVQAAGPQPTRWESWKKHFSAAIAVMKPWSWEELYIGGSKFISPPLEALTLRNSFVKYGGSARHCYSLAKSPDKVTEWEKQIPRILTRIPDLAIFEGYIVGNTNHRVESVIEALSQIVTIIPNPTRQPCVTLVSRHIAEHFFRAVLIHNHERFWNYFDQFSSVSESRTAARWLWELYAIRVALSTQSTLTTPINLYHLSSIESSQPLTKKARPNPIELPFSDIVDHGDQKALGKELSAAIPSLSPTKSILYRPGTSNQVTFNAFSISGDKQVTLYQATIRESHPINAEGLDFVWDSLKLAEGQGMSAAKKLLPSTTRKWRLVFLIPKEVEKHWKTAQSIDFGGIEPKHQWSQYVEQYVGVLQKNTTADLILP